MKINDITLRKWYRKYLSDMETLAAENVVVVENMGKRLKIDEVCLHKGDFWTILSNADTKKAVAIMKGTKVEVLSKQLDKIPVSLCMKVKEVTLDMSPSFDWLVRQYFMNSSKVIDRFHVQKEVYEALQEMRIKERRRVLKEERENKQDKTKFSNGDTRRQLLARSRGLLFKPQKKWTQSQQERAAILFEEYPDIHKAYLLTQEFKLWYDKKHKKPEARKKLYKWYQRVQDSGYKPLIEKTEMIQRHEGWILNYFDNRSTNAYAESLNSNIKLFKRLVRGIRKPEFFIFRLSTYIT